MNVGDIVKSTLSKKSGIITNVFDDRVWRISIVEVTWFDSAGEKKSMMKPYHLVNVSQ